MGEELSGMLRGVPPQNILIAFDDKPAKSLADLKSSRKSPPRRNVDRAMTGEVTGMMDKNE